MKYLAKKIQDLRKEYNYSQDDLADKIGVSRQAISKWEREEGLPDLYNMKKLAEVFNLTVDDLIQEYKKEELPIKKKTNVPLVLLFISIFVIVPAFLFLTPTIIAAGIFFIDNIIHLYRLEGIPSFLILLVIFPMYPLIRQFVNIYLEIDFTKSRIKEIILFGILVLGYLLLLTKVSISGFSFIFLYIVGLLILTSGLVGSILYNQGIKHSVSKKAFSIYNKTMTVIKYIIFVYIGLFVISLIQSNFLVVETRYYNEYQVRSSDSEFFLQFKNNEDCSDFDYFNHKISFRVDLDNDITNPYIKIYMGTFLVTEGDMLPLDDATYNYYYFKETDNVQTPLIFTSNSELFSGEYTKIQGVLTYTQNDEVITENIPIYSYIHLSNTEAVYKNFWIWDYKNLIN